MAPADPNHAAYVKGDALWKQGRFKEAARFFLVAVEEWPEDYQALWALGNCYTELKKPRKAEDAFCRAIEACAGVDRYELMFNLANALFDQKRFAEALALYLEIPTGHRLAQKAKRNATLAKSRSPLD
jgi:tetratricopeptide (TPR) repeat protein